MLKNSKKTEKSINPIRYDIENYLSDNIEYMQEQLNKNESLYSEIYEKYKEISNVANFHNFKDNIEMANTLSKIRATNIDGADKLFKAKLSILDTEQKMRKLNIEKDSENNTEIVMQQLNQILSSNKDIKDQINSPNNNNKNTKNDFNHILDKKIEEGTIKLTENDKKALQKFNSNEEKTSIEDIK